MNAIVDQNACSNICINHALADEMPHDVNKLARSLFIRVEYVGEENHGSLAAANRGVAEYELSE